VHNNLAVYCVKVRENWDDIRRDRHVGDAKRLRPEFLPGASQISFALLPVFESMPSSSVPANGCRLSARKQTQTFYGLALHRN
jgi:hypothetical protein